jgi:glucokinase
MYLLFDIGGTKIRLARGEAGLIDEPRIIATPRQFKDGITAIEKVALEIGRGAQFDGVCGGIAGVLNRGKTRLVHGPHLKGWEGKQLVSSLGKIFGAPVHLENDAAMAGLGEAVYGAGQGFGIVQYYTIGTGVGGARIVNGAIDAASYGFEPGHQIIMKCGAEKRTRPRTLEEYVSGSGLAFHYQKDPSRIHEEKIWNETAVWLAHGLYNSMLHWSPEVIVLGGGLIIHNAILLKVVRKALRAFPNVYPKMPTIKRAKLGDVSGLYGALANIEQVQTGFKPVCTY